MLKIVISGVWICSVTIAALYASQTRGLFGGEPDLPGAHTTAKPFKTDDIAVAIFKSGKVAGYFTGRIMCDVIDPAYESKLAWLLTHELHKAIYQNPTISYGAPSKEDLTLLAKFMSDALNGQDNPPVIANLKIENVDFLKRL